MSKAVRNISMKRPCAIEVPCERRVSTAMGPGNMADTRAEATMPPANWGMKRSAPRMGGRAPLMTRPRVICCEGGS